MSEDHGIKRKTKYKYKMWTLEKIQALKREAWEPLSLWGSYQTSCQDEADFGPESDPSPKQCKAKSPRPWY